MKNYDLPRAILGEDFISPEDVINSRKGISYTEEQLVKFSETVPAQEILEWCRDNNYMLIVGPSCSIYNNGVFYVDKDKFNTEKVETKWYMVCKNLVSSSVYTNWEEQQKLLSEFEMVLNAVEFLWAITVYKVVRGIYLFRGVSVRTSSLDLDGNNIYVNVFSDRKPTVGYHWDGDRESNLGFVVARK